MLIDRRNETGLTCKFQLLIILATVLFSPALLHTNEIKPQSVLQFDRADVETIKTHTHQILSEPDFAPRKTFWQWLMQKFSRFKGPKFNLRAGWGKFILSFILIWCILTLVAILIHFIWTISLLIRSNVNLPSVKGHPGSKSVKTKSFEELYKMAHQLAKDGEFHEAISMMILALLRFLDSMDVIHFHESKTNGDYIREYTSDHAGRNEFKKFVLIYEQTIYGRLYESGQMYQQMNSLMENVRNCVTQKA